MAVNGCQWLSMAVNGCPMDVNGCPMKVNGCQWLSMAVNGCQWLSIDVNGLYTRCTVVTLIKGAV
jgi:hypothetical protein